MRLRSLEEDGSGMLGAAVATPGGSEGGNTEYLSEASPSSCPCRVSVSALALTDGGGGSGGDDDDDDEAAQTPTCSICLASAAGVTPASGMGGSSSSSSSSSATPGSGRSVLSSGSSPGSGGSGGGDVAPVVEMQRALRAQGKELQRRKSARQVSAMRQQQ